VNESRFSNFFIEKRDFSISKSASPREDLQNEKTYYFAITCTSYGVGDVHAGIDRDFREQRARRQP